ncbi:MAG TPA: hypothetical protein VKU39_20400 [Streptosporangiaceae bacterium]|nr:hypothetical protein [Streptosporangiaceae bacterium]
MRHLYGAAMAVALAAALFFGTTWGYLRVTRTFLPYANGLPANGGSLYHYHNVLTGGGVLLAVGLAVGLAMVIPWVSPLASGLPGLVLLAWSGLYLSDVKDAFRLIPLKNRDFGAGFEALLMSGLLAAVAIGMIVPLFVPSRWRRPARQDADESTLISPEVGTVYEETIVGFPATPPSTGSNVVTEWGTTQTQPVAGQGPITPPGGARAPWDPAP